MKLDNAEEGWHTRDGGRRSWDHVAKSLGTIENFYLREIEATLSLPTTPDALAYLVERYRVSVAAKLECYVLLDEMEQGQAYAEKAWSRSTTLFDRITPLTLAKAFAKTDASDTQSAEVLRSARAICLCLRELQDMHGSAPFLLRELKDLAVQGRDYVESLRSESREPFLVLRMKGEPT